MMHDLEELPDVINIELVDIKVSKELKLKTLNKCKTIKRTFFHKAYIPIACTMAACLFMGVIIYPIYNKSNIMEKQQITMNTSEIDINKEDKETMDSTSSSNEDDIMKNQNSRIGSNEMVDENQKEVNESVKEKNDINGSKDNSIVALKKETVGEDDKKGESMVAVGKDAIDTTNGDTIQNDKYIKDDSESTSIALSEGNVKVLAPDDGVKMKSISPQEAIKIFAGDIKIPTYVPMGFALEKILVPEFNYNLNKVYEVIYNNNSQYFKIVKYNNTNISGDLSSNAAPEKGLTEESNMVINLNNIPVKYAMYEGTNIMESTFVKLTWEDRGIRYSVEGNASFGELISIVSSIIK